MLCWHTLVPRLYPDYNYQSLRGFLPLDKEHYVSGDPPPLILSFLINSVFRSSLIKTVVAIYNASSVTWISLLSSRSDDPHEEKKASHEFSLSVKDTIRKHVSRSYLEFFATDEGMALCVR